jgi:hypothetical protein
MYVFMYTFTFESGIYALLTVSDVAAVDAVESVSVVATPHTLRAILYERSKRRVTNAAFCARFV